MVIAAYALETGARTHEAWATRMVEELGEAIRPHLARLYEDAVVELTARAAAYRAAEGVNLPAARRIISDLLQDEGRRKEADAPAAAPAGDVREARRITLGSDYVGFIRAQSNATGSVAIHRLWLEAYDALDPIMNPEKWGEMTEELMAGLLLAELGGVDVRFRDCLGKAHPSRSVILSASEGSTAPRR